MKKSGELSEKLALQLFIRGIRDKFRPKLSIARINNSLEERGENRFPRFRAAPRYSGVLHLIDSLRYCSIRSILVEKNGIESGKNLSRVLMNFIGSE